METKRDIFTSFSVIVVVIFMAMLINITYNLRGFGIADSKEKAELISESVKNGLTAHMVNGIMQNRDFYINRIKDLENVDNIWIVRADNVNKQFGKGKEMALDDIDKEVLKKGEPIQKLNENLLGHNSYRITIPYKAEVTPNIDCTSCHEAKVGDVLGAISIVLSVDSTKIMSSKIITYTSLISLILIIVIFVFVRNLITPYLSIFESIKNVMRNAHEGDYSGRIIGINSGEAQEVAHWINEHMIKIQSSLNNMEDKIDIFLNGENKQFENIDAVVDVENTVSRLADIYKFRKTIEHDQNIEHVYQRFATVLEEKFNIKDFNFPEADTTNKKIEIVYISKEILCDPISNGCRCDRTNSVIDSCQFKEVCEKFKSDKFYLCIPYSISNDLDFIVSMIFETEEEHTQARELLPFIQDYIDAAKPEIVSKKLMQILERNAQTDPLTGLFNRKYLENYIEGSLYNGKFKGVPCGVMMVDIDFFKLINDNYGHDIGDIAIKTIANTLIDVTDQDKDIVIRFGGEEFIVVVTDVTPERAIEIAEKIRIAFSQQKIQAGAETFSKTVSVGVSYFENKDKSFWKSVKQSDIAMYEAKHTGRDKVVLFKEGMA